MASRSLPALPGLLHSGASFRRDRNLARLQKLRDGAPDGLTLRDAVSLMERHKARLEGVIDVERIPESIHDVTSYQYVHTLSTPAALHVAPRQREPDSVSRTASATGASRRPEGDAPASGYPSPSPGV